MMMVMAGIFGVVLMAVLGTYYFRNKKRHRKTALFCKALATSVSGLLLLGYLYGARTGESAGGVLSGWADGVILEAAFAGTLAAIVFYMAADVLLECRFIWGAVCFGGRLLIKRRVCAASGEKQRLYCRHRPVLSGAGCLRGTHGIRMRSTP